MRRFIFLMPVLVALTSIAAVHAQAQPLPLRTGGMIPYPAGWNLLAGFPGLAGSQTVVSGAAGPLYTFQAGDTQYESIPNTTPLVAGPGYWAFFVAPTSVAIPQLPPTSPPLSEPLPRNQFVMIGNPFQTAATVSGADVVYTYDQQQGYLATTTLKAGQGAWAFSAGGGNVVLAQPGSGGQTLDRCHTSQLTASFVTSEGAAGHIFDTLGLTNTSGTSCTLFGFVGGQMLNASGAQLPTRVVRNGGMLSNQPGPTQFTLAPGATAIFVVEWSDVPTGNETSCPSAAQLEITPPDETDFLVLMLSRFALAPCNSGTLNVTPVLPPGSHVP